MRMISNNNYSIRLRVFSLLLAGFMAVLVSGCNKDKVAPKVSAVPALSSSASSVVLTHENAAQPAITFSWTNAQVSGMQGSVTYFIQWDLKGNNFANPTSVKIGRDTLKAAYTQGAFNNLVSTLPPAVASQIEVRLVVATSDGSVAPFYSNVISLTVTPYAKAIPPPFNQLWLVGDATPAGWNIDSPTPMLEDATDPYIFTYTGNLSAGEFKIPTATGNWGVQFYRPVTNHPALSDPHVQLSAGDPDNKWQITKASKYKITLNLHTLTISIIDLNDTTPPPYSKLWIVGDATPAGWNINAPTPMVQDSTDPFVFTYTGPLTAGEFKIPVGTGDWGVKFYRPVVNHPDLSDTQVVLLDSNSGDFKWLITDPGNYKITLNLRNLTINTVKF